MLEKQLYSPQQLPDIADTDMIFDWDQDEAESIVRYHDLELWRETTGWEVYERFAEIVEILHYKYGESLKDVVPTPASRYALLGDSSRASIQVESVRAGLGRKPELQTYQLSTLANAIRSGESETIRRFLAQGGNPDEREDSTGIGLLQLATQRRQTAIVKMLILAGANVNALDHDGRSPLFEALAEPTRPGGGVTSRGFQMPTKDANPPRIDLSTEIVKILVDAGASLDGLGVPIEGLQGWAKRIYRPPLALAAQHGHMEAFRFLLARGADPNQEDFDYQKVIHFAAYYGNCAAVQILAAAGVDLNVSFPPNKYTPLLMAIRSPYTRRRRLSVVRLLVECGADINKCDKRAISPLLAVIGEVERELLQFMIDAGADLHHRNGKGNNALCELILRTRLNRWPQAEIVPLIKLLLAAGADPHAKNSDQKTARELAQEAGLSELAALL